MVSLCSHLIQQPQRERNALLGSIQDFALQYSRPSSHRSARGFGEPGLVQCEYMTALPESPAMVAASSPASRSATPRKPTTPRPGTAELCRRAEHLAKEVALVQQHCSRQLEELAKEVTSPGRSLPRSRQESRYESAKSIREAEARRVASEAKWERIHTNWLAGQQPTKSAVPVEVVYSYMAVVAEKKTVAEVRAAARAEAERKAKERVAAFQSSLARAPAERALVAKALRAKAAVEERHDGRWPKGRDPFEVPRKAWVY